MNYNIIHAPLAFVLTTLRQALAASSGRWRRRVLDKKRVLIVEDHPLLRAGLSALIGDDCQVFEADDLPSSQQIIFNEFIDLAIVGVHLASGNGFDIIRFLRSSSPLTKCLVLTEHSEPLYDSLARFAGANGVVSKSMIHTLLIEAIETLMRGEFYPASFETCGTLGDLSSQERKVFESIGAGATIDEIAELLECAPKTIRAYRDHIGRISTRQRSHQPRDFTIAANSLK